MGHSRGSFRGRTGNRRQTSWEDGVGGGAPTGLASSTTAFIGQALQAQLPGLTVIRQRGVFEAHLTLATSALDGFHGAFGIGIASLAAVTAGVASVPTPITEQNSDNWLYWLPFTLTSPVASGGAVSPLDPIVGISAAIRVEVDTKAMRKFDTDLALYAIVEVVEIGTSSIDISYNGRTLVKLP